MANGNISEVLGALDNIIRDPVKRQRFVEHPDLELEAEGYVKGDVPSQIWEALTRMTFDELKAISDLTFALAEAGLLNGHLSWTHGV
jgi:hypothetical protein